MCTLLTLLLFYTFFVPFFSLHLTNLYLLYSSFHSIAQNLSTYSIVSLFFDHFLSFRSGWNIRSSSFDSSDEQSFDSSDAPRDDKSQPILFAPKVAVYRLDEVDEVAGLLRLNTSGEKINVDNEDWEEPPQPLMLTYRPPDVERFEYRPSEKIPLPDIMFSRREVDGISKGQLLNEHPPKLKSISFDDFTSFESNFKGSMNDGRCELNSDAPTEKKSKAGQLMRSL